MAIEVGTILQSIADIEAAGLVFPGNKTHLFIAIKSDGSREYLRDIHLRPHADIRTKLLNSWVSLEHHHLDGYHLIYWGEEPWRILAGPGSYLPYLDPDTSLADRRRPNQLGPVNPVPLVDTYRQNVARIAHEADQSYGLWSTQGQEEADREKAMRYVRNLVGITWHYLGRWSEVDPEELTNGLYDWIEYPKVNLNRCLTSMMAHGQVTMFVRSLMESSLLDAIDAQQDNLTIPEIVVGSDGTWTLGDPVRQISTENIPEDTLPRHHTNFDNAGTRGFDEAVKYYTNVSGGAHSLK